LAQACCRLAANQPRWAMRKHSRPGVKEVRDGPLNLQLEQMWRLYETQQAQLDTIRRQQRDLLDQSAVLCECLEASGAVTTEAFHAKLHRRRFHEVLRRHPFKCCESFESLLHTREMMVSLAKSCGRDLVTQLARVGRAFGRTALEARPELVAAFAPTIYVIGGEVADEDATCTVERLCPALILSGQGGSATWEPVAPLPAPRAYCAAAALGGCVYVYGGSTADGGFLRSAERYDPSLNCWEALPPMQVSRVALSAAAAHNRLWAIGGNNDMLVHSSVECFDPKANAWQPMPPMRHPRWAAAATAVGGQLVVVGGRDNEDVVLRSVECLKFAENTGEALDWVAIPSLRTARASLAAATVRGCIYAMGGYDVTLQDLGSLERYDPVSGDGWQELSSMRAPRFGLGALACAGSLYILGGAYGDVDGVVFETVERYDPEANQWLSGSGPGGVVALKRPRRRFGVVAC